MRKTEPASQIGKCTCLASCTLVSFAALPPSLHVYAVSRSIDCIRHLTPTLQLLGIEPLGLHANMQQRQRLKNLDRSVELPWLLCRWK